ncbi:hypothetical protein QJS10_CPB20g00963 [Acorus calamus]|uniref:Uncharacterized protein n=1 Tax=Acorus calamus TaxID=4465 RepID=A0AAV9CB68_ACOCL|nr:hypothetical protein QJS10_CPB20g00963 [Acorus calamus]
MAEAVAAAAEVGIDLGLDEQVENFILEDMVFEHGTSNATQNPTPTGTTPSSSNATRSHKKRARSSQDMSSCVSEIASSISSLVECSKEYLKIMASSLTPENLISMVAETLTKMEGFTRQQKMVAARIISKEPSYVEMFLMCPEEERGEMVEEILAYETDY